VTTGFRLVELNAKTGAVITSFADNGLARSQSPAVQKGNNEQIDLERGEIGIHAAPTVTGDVLIVGSSMREGATVPTHNNTKGVVRAYDVRTGKELWRFNTIRGPANSATRPGRTIPGRRTATLACGAHHGSRRNLGLAIHPGSRRRRRIITAAIGPGSNLLPRAWWRST